jgi:hypothetical protein
MNHNEKFAELSKKYSSLIPLEGKRPIEKGWQRWCREPRQFDPKEFEGRNAGIPCGPTNGILVLDIDDYKAFKALWYETHRGLRPTYCVQTGENRYHLYYQYPPDGMSYQNRSHKGVFDVKGDGGVVVAPGSIHPDTGQQYEVIADLPIAEPMPWLLAYSRKRDSSQILSPSPVSSQAGEDVPVVIDSLPISDETQALIRNGEKRGRRSEAIQKVINALVAVGLSDVQIMAVFDTYPIGAKYHEKGASKFKWLKAQIDKGRTYVAQKNGQIITPKPYPNVYTAAELEKKDIFEPEWIIYNFIAPGVTLLAGPPKAGKTRLVSNIALSVPVGGKALGALETIECGVLFLCLEDTERTIKDRLVTINNGVPLPDNLYLSQEWPKMGNGGSRELDQWIGEHSDVRLLIIDVLARFRNPKSSRDVYQHDYDTISRIKTVADKHSIAVIVVHHNNKLKDSPDVFDRVSGSTGLTAASDTVMVLERYNRVDREGKLQIAGREVIPQEMALEYDPDLGTWKYVGDASLFSMSPERYEIFTYLENEENPKGPEEVAQALGKNPNTVRVTLRKMVKDGQLCQPAYGLYTTSNKFHKQS